MRHLKSWNAEKGFDELMNWWLFVSFPEYCLFLNMVDSFHPLFFNICLSIRKKLTRPTGRSWRPSLSWLTLLLRTLTSYGYCWLFWLCGGFCVPLHQQSRRSRPERPVATSAWQRRTLPTASERASNGTGSAFRRHRTTDAGGTRSLTKMIRKETFTMADSSQQGSVSGRQRRGARWSPPPPKKEMPKWKECKIWQQRLPLSTTRRKGQLVESYRHGGPYFGVGGLWL